MELKSYSINTIKSYKGAVAAFLDYFYPRNIESLLKTEIEDYLLLLAKEKKYTPTAIHTAVNAIKFYLEQVTKRHKEYYKMQRPKKPIQNPTVFSENEIEMIINAITNEKHKAMIMIGYAAGLRVSEIVLS